VSTLKKKERTSLEFTNPPHFKCASLAASIVPEPHTLSWFVLLPCLRIAAAGRASLRGYRMDSKLL
jgi:hypothetical protein